MDFSTVEDDALAFELIQKLVNNAGKYAAAEARARGFWTVYVRDNLSSKSLNKPKKDLYNGTIKMFLRDENIGWLY
jgi:hypothetical protein